MFGINFPKGLVSWKVNSSLEIWSSNDPYKSPVVLSVANVLFLVCVIRTCGDSEFEIAGILRERWGSLAVCMYFAPFLQNRAMETVQLGIL